MDRYLGMGSSYNSNTGAMTASMYHFVLKILAIFQTSSLQEQRTPYTMDLFDRTDDPTPVDLESYQKLVGQLIWTLILRFETQLSVICVLAYLKGCPELGPT